MKYIENMTKNILLVSDNSIDKNIFVFFCNIYFLGKNIYKKLLKTKKFLFSQKIILKIHMHFFNNLYLIVF